MFAGETRRGKAGPGTKDGSPVTAVLHGSGCILLPSFCLFFSLGWMPLWGCDGGQGADMMDGTGGHGRAGVGSG